MLLNGVVDAAVMGGIVNYEKAFFNDEYLKRHPTKKDIEKLDKLKDLIALQIPILDVGISIHRQKAPKKYEPFIEKLN